MSVIGKVMTLLRGSVREIGESVVDANATRIYEQEILDAKQSIVKAKDDLAGVMAKEMQSARALQRLPGSGPPYPASHRNRRPHPSAARTQSQRPGRGDPERHCSRSALTGS